ncbi:coiled-coil domain-containing protein 54 [Ornithorhynchus anatinus]|uniref:coiled-coil domain-containing protein 54 n=1 Tax=Ornithorhynchus anatinus TaxID=9258 RepID=UPI0000EDFBB3|nr:coiled-coil domain-containing protein 54 [Ornithorhynchus anatinus]
MHRLSFKNLKSTAENLWNSHFIRLRGSIKNGSRARSPNPTSGLSEGDEGRPSQPLPRNQELDLAAAVQDIRTGQASLYEEMMDVVGQVAVMNDKFDAHQKQMEALGDRVRANEVGATKLDKYLCTLDQTINLFQEKAADLGSQCECPGARWEESPEETEEREMMDLLHRLLMMPLAQEEAPDSQREPSAPTPGEDGWVPIKSVRQPPWENPALIPEQAAAEIYVYPDFGTWIDLAFPLGTKRRVLLSTTRLEELMRWILTRSAFLEIPQQRSAFSGPIGWLNTLCFSTCNYLYWLYLSLKERVTWM